MARWGGRRPQGILLYGPPGTGKTMLVGGLRPTDADQLRRRRRGRSQPSGQRGRWHLGHHQLPAPDGRLADPFRALRRQAGHPAACGLAALTPGPTGADIREVLRRVRLAKAMREATESAPVGPISQDDVRDAIAGRRRG
ncbi:hypothetical protein [Micromonospora sp. NPDC050200]|uniref:hypothetical protein n=1 Tax=Micromonospora sp. NPDC050200 TaxID=3155664 RepID=UPI0033FE0F44